MYKCVVCYIRTHLLHKPMHQTKLEYRKTEGSRWRTFSKEIRPLLDQCKAVFLQSGTTLEQWTIRHFETHSLLKRDVSQMTVRDNLDRKWQPCERFKPQ
jgi:hypothetical protein